VFGEIFLIGTIYFRVSQNHLGKLFYLNESQTGMYTAHSHSSFDKARARGKEERISTLPR
jgi:hypothetical protein